jgi:hypothetical protein
MIVHQPRFMLEWDVVGVWLALVILPEMFSFIECHERTGKSLPETCLKLIKYEPKSEKESYLCVVFHCRLLSMLLSVKTLQWKSVLHPLQILR